MDQRVVSSLSITLIYGNPRQPRKLFDEAGLQELSENIKSVGLKQPITVVPRPALDGRIYMIVCGERRFRASQLAGLEEIPAIIDELTDQEVQEIALIENVCRKDMTLLEEAQAYQDMLDSGHTVESLAKLLGYKQPERITMRTSLLKLDPKFQDALTKGIITPEQARYMAKLSIEGQFKLWNHIQDGRCSNYKQLTALTDAIRDAENQVELFRNEVTEQELYSLDKVDQFINGSARFLTSITEDDLAVMKSVLRSDAPACIAKLTHLMAVAKKVRDALETNLAKQRASEGLAA